MNILLVLILAVLIISAQSALFKRFWAKGLSFDITFSKKYAFEGEKATLTETVANRKLLPLPLLGVKFQVSRNLVFLDNTNSAVSDYYYRNDQFSVLMYQKIIRSLDFNCSKRGYYSIRNADLVSVNILLSDKLSLSAPVNAAITVYPKIIDASKLEIAARQLQGDIFTKRFINPDPFQFKGIREYLPLDELKSINFKATAKTGELMVNLKEFTVTQEIILILNLQDYTVWPSSELFEECIRLTASLASFYIDGSVPVSLVTNGRDIITKQPVSAGSGSSSVHLTGIYEQLARIDMGQPRDVMSAHIYDLAGRSSGECVFVLISTYHEEDLQRAFEYIGFTFASLWIAPAYKAMELKLKEADNILRWDVELESVNS